MSLFGSLGSVVYDIVANDKTSYGVESAGRRIQTLGEATKSVGQSMSLWITAPLTAFGVLSVKAAGDAAETRSKFDQVFQGMSVDAEAWAESYGDAVGRATTDLQGMLATTMSIVKAMGMSYDEGSQFSETITQLSIDMASFNNTADADAFTALRSAITGEYEPMKRFGVVLNEAKVQQELLNLGIRGGASAATDAEKAQARMNLILAATADAQGDAARTAGSFSNQLKALQADMTEMAETIGEDLLPIAQSGIDIASVWIERFESLDETAQRVIITMGGLAAALGPAIWVTGSMVSSVGQIKIALDTYRASELAATIATDGLSSSMIAAASSSRLLMFATNPLVLSIGAATIAGIALYQAIEEIHANTVALTEAENDLKDATKLTDDELQKHIDTLEKSAQYYDALARRGGELAKVLGTEFSAMQEFTEAGWIAGLDRAEEATYRNERAIRDLNTAYNETQSQISDLEGQYRSLGDAIKEALEFPESLSDQERAIERAEIAMERAAENLARVQKDSSSTGLDLRDAELGVREAVDAWEGAKKKLSEMETTGVSEILDGQTLEEARAQYAGLGDQIAIAQGHLAALDTEINTPSTRDANTGAMIAGVIGGDAGSAAFMQMLANGGYTAPASITTVEAPVTQTLEINISVGSADQIVPVMNQTQAIAEFFKSSRIQRGIR